MLGLRHLAASGGWVEGSWDSKARLDAGTGREQFAIAWRLALLGWLGCVLLQLALYLRPGPYGGPFLVEWQRIANRSKAA